MLYRIRQLVAPFIFLVSLSAMDCTAQNLAGLSGTIRDFQGKPQMGVLVELFGPASALQALTDVQGHYQFRNVIPGIYQLRASATLYLPSLRKQLQLPPHGASVVNLTLNGLFDESGWISTRSDRMNQKDDWNWTLRSPENRPILRIADDGVNGTYEQRSLSSETRSAITTSFSKGSFGASGLSESFQVAHRSQNQRTVLSVHSQIVQTETASLMPPLFLAAALQNEGAVHIRSVIAARVETFPQIYSNSAAGLAVMDLASAERVEIGDFAKVEVGSETHLVTAGRSTLINRSFLNIATRAVSGWTASYAGATSPEFTRFDDVGGGAGSAPAVVPARTKLLTETGSHQQIGVRKTFEHASIRLDYQHDAARRAAVSGQILALPRAGDISLYRLSPPALNALAYDSSNGSFRMFAPGYLVNGFDVGADVSLGHALSASSTYIRSVGAYLLSAPSGVDQAAFAIGQSQAFLTVVQGKFVRSGTRISASYRWQPSRMMSVVAPYTQAGIGSYLGLHLQQSLFVRRLGSNRVAIVVDGGNLLGEGYHSYLVGVQSANIASALREIHAGLAFSY